MSLLRSSIFALLLGIAAAPLSCSRPRTAATPSVEPVTWARFDGGAFERARREDRLVLVDVGIEGCTACRWMHEETYANPEVRARLRAHFVTVAVDADAEPDLGARWERWGWPATIVLTADGTQVLALQGNIHPSRMIALLDELVRRKSEGRLLDSTVGALATGPDPVSGDLGAVCAAGSSSLLSAADRDHGGFGLEGPAVHREQRAAVRLPAREHLWRRAEPGARAPHARGLGEADRPGLGRRVRRRAGPRLLQADPREAHDP
ncbi:MAG: DUF255 domain-containing protein [Deltaproteobacteria bacterium]|nr:DUF255 domain-containing protein [Deltaproteobacteria bacterium]